MYSIKLFAICFLLAFMVNNVCCSACRPFNKTSGIAELCGYTATAKYMYKSHYDVAVRSMLSVSRILSSCADQAALIVCSVFVPRCEETIPGPYLPCRRVCDDFHSKCSDEIIKFGMEWIVGMCRLLPEKDDPNTKRGYLGRCFEPPKFTTNIQKRIPLKCNKLIVPICRHIGYTYTITPEETQRANFDWASQKINDIAGTESTKCSLAQRRFYCMETFPPCDVNNNRIGFYCRQKCHEFFKMNCTSPMKYKEDICMEMPRGSGLNDVCYQTEWPRAGNWPQVRNNTNSMLASPTAKSVGKTNAAKTIQPPTYASNSVQANNASAVKDKSKGKKQSKASVTSIVGGILAGLFAIAIVLLMSYLIYKNRKRKETFQYDKHITYNDENVEMA